MYSGCPGDSDAAKTEKSLITESVSKSVLLDPNHEAKVAGNKMMLDAKIGGITPAIFNLSGRWDV